MSNVRDERVENALQSLLERLVPQLPDEDEEAADKRWDQANVIARRRLARESEPSVRADVNHAADLITRRLIHGRGRADLATRFSNLYSRLLTQPVLNQKWAILFFLYQLSEDKSRADNSHNGKSMSRGGLGTHVRTDSFDKGSIREALARNGLPRPARTGAQGEHRSPSVRESVITPSRPSAQPAAQISPPVASPPNLRSIQQKVPSESTLLRAIPFTLQGLSSTTLTFADNSTLRLPASLPAPLIALLHALAEPSLLYKGLSVFVDSKDASLVGQGIRAAFEKELRLYLGLVATLEGQIRRSLAQADEQATDGQAHVQKATVTLKRCVVWTRDATLGLRLMSAIVDLAKDKKGGELISLVSKFASSHGDPFVYTFAKRLLNDATRPWYSMLRAWIYDGELEDPYSEFFVYENAEYEDNGATSVWDHKYMLNEAMIPSIISLDLAKRIFLIGKSLNFIRHGCGESAWVEAYSKDASREFAHGDMAVLDRNIDEAYKTVMAQLTSLVENKFSLSLHLAALKKYLLLGQGDFIALLMESLASNLDRPANSQYRHTLTAQLEHAIRNSNAQFESPDVLRRLDARMLELSHGEIGWDVFTLEYRVDPPLDVIVTPWASKQYLKVFNFLWRVKRVEFALSTTWRRVQTGARGVIGAVSDKFGTDWKSARGGLAEMVHFVDQLQYYILFEVIEAGWEGLQREMRKADATLDSLVSAHITYLRSITRKGLLSGSAGGGLDFTTQLHEILKLMLAYHDAVDSLYSHSVAEFTRRQERSAKAETRPGVRHGDFNDTEGRAGAGSKRPISSRLDSYRDHDGDTDMPLPGLLSLPHDGDTERNLLDQLRVRLSELKVDFRARVNVLLGDLAYQPDVDMRFLGVVMNFNEAYAPVKRRRHRPDERDQTGSVK